MDVANLENLLPSKIIQFMVNISRIIFLLVTPKTMKSAKISPSKYLGYTVPLYAISTFKIIIFSLLKLVQ